jgi:hypothetical protein
LCARFFGRTKKEKIIYQDKESNWGLGATPLKEYQNAKFKIQIYPLDNSAIGKMVVTTNLAMSLWDYHGFQTASERAER